ncbi:hypothetical protein B0O80DRAFT_459213, partial [Mortierella sp. GBAus27b]
MVKLSISIAAMAAVVASVGAAPMSVFSSKFRPRFVVTCRLQHSRQVHSIHASHLHPPLLSSSSIHHALVPPTLKTLPIHSQQLLRDSRVAFLAYL